MPSARTTTTTTETTTTTTETLETLELERARVETSVRHLERSCEEIARAREDALASEEDKATYDAALIENARAIANGQERIYDLTREIEWRRSVRGG